MAHSALSMVTQTGKLIEGPRLRAGMMEPLTQALFLVLTFVGSATGQSITCPAACDCPSAAFITCDMMTDGFPVFADEDKPLIQTL